MPDKIIKENLFDPYKRRSELEDIPDDFVARMMNSGQKGGELNIKPEVRMPNGFTIAPAYNKGAYMVVPRTDTDAYTNRK
tara:strand:+ start:1212 stop:1451 length:240 start_codon:yes stop_codon:yes gene_type:complete